MPWPAAEALLRQRPGAGSRWQVLLAVALTSCRYGDRDALLEVSDVARLTGLSERTVKAALAELMASGLVMRVGRYGRLRCAVLGAGGARGASSVAPLTRLLHFTG